MRVVRVFLNGERVDSETRFTIDVGVTLVKIERLDEGVKKLKFNEGQIYRLELGSREPEYLIGNYEYVERVDYKRNDLKFQTYKFEKAK